MKMTVRHSAELAALYQHAGVKGKKLLEMYPQYSKASVYRHAKRLISMEAPVDKRKLNKGRPRKLTEKDIRSIKRAIPKLRKTDGSFTAPRVMNEAGLVGRVSLATVHRELNKLGFQYLQSRKKGFLSAEDLIKRLAFCRKVKRLKLTQNFWREGISFYLDAKGFQYKTNPLDQARAPMAREWRRKGEGLRQGCTAKGSKEGAVNCNFMVAISYNKGVVLCDEFEGAISGDKMVDIVKRTLPEAFERSINPQAKRLLMDGCPRQNCKKALKAIDDVHGKVFKIPARSPDLNPIENFFHLAARELKKDALLRRITYEAKHQFSERECVIPY